MNPQPEHGKKWQISLANVLVFVFAVAIWFLAATLASNVWLSNATLVVMLAGMVGSFLAWRRGRLGILLLVVLFEFIVVGQLLGLSYLRALNSEKYNSQIRLLRIVSGGLNTYYRDWKEYPPPPADLKQCGAELHRLLTTQGRKHNGHHRGKKLPPTLPYLDIQQLPPGQTATDKILGGTGNELQWMLNGTGRFILIDVGEDGFAGKYSFEGKEIRKTPVDANRDGIDDGADDTFAARTWESIVQ